VIEERDRIYGDGVNIAARLEALADPGGICISKTAFDHIETKLPLGYEYLGEQEVKNIAKPVGAYKVMLDPRVTISGKKESKPSWPLWRKKGVLTGIAAVIVIAIALGVLKWYYTPSLPSIEPASVDKMAYPLPDKPSIAVLPFDNLSGESEQDYFADGIAEDIITRLSLIHNLFVISRNSSFSYKGKQVKVHQVAEELGVRYVLEGSVRKSGDQVRITAQLIDAIKGTHLWADRYDRELKDVFAVQDEIAQKVVTELAVTTSEGEAERYMLRGTDNWEAWVNYRKAVAQFRRFNKAANLKARELSEKAIALDTDYSQAYSLLSWTYSWPVRFGLSSSPADDLNKAAEFAKKASELDASNYDAQNALGFIYMLRGQYDHAIIQGKRAVELYPNIGDTYALLALSQSFAGHYTDAIDSSIKAMRLVPFYPPWYLTTLYRSYFMAGNFEETIETIHRALEKIPDHQNAPVWLAAAYAALGKPEKARAEAEKLLEKKPAFSLEEFSKAFPFKNRADFDRVLAYAREAGLPDKPPLPLPDKPSIAVLPFVNMSGDPKQEYFSDGITEEIITALSKTPKLFVIARTSSFKYKGKEVDLRAVGRELGVRYVLEGSVRKAGDEVRITAQLIEAKTNHHLWAESYDRKLRDVFAVQDEITKEIITSLQVKLTEGEQARVWARGTDNLQAYLKNLEGWHHASLHNKEDNAIARRLAEEAIALDPEYPLAYALLSLTHRLDPYFKTTKSPKLSFAKARELSEKAISLDPSNPICYGTLTAAYRYTAELEKAIDAGEKAITLGPSLASAHYALGTALRWGGRADESIPILKKAIRLDPLGTRAYWNLGFSYLVTRQCKEAIEVCRIATQANPKDLLANIGLVCGYILCGQEEEARAAARQVLKINPKFTADKFINLISRGDKERKERLNRSWGDWLRKAGL
jgi:adenylate cyclase